MKTFYIITILLFILLAGTNVFGQTTPSMTTDISSVLKPAPNAASLGKFFETPVSLYTGIPEINIPLTSIQEGEISLPVSLSYHAGGIKVDEVASSAGLGWSLNAGGVITRSTRGLPDNIPSFKMETGSNIYRFMHGLFTNTEIMDYVLGIHDGLKDSESDIYYVNVGSIGCKFYIDTAGKFVTMPRSANIKIEYGTGGFHWVITDGKGIVYKFGQKETTHTLNSAQVNSGGFNETGTIDVPSTWYVSEIEDTKGNKVTFDYTTSFVYVSNYGTQTVSVPVNNPTQDINCQSDRTVSYSFSTTDQKRISKIAFPEGSVQFGYDDVGRTDLPGDNALKYISIYDNKNTQLKRYRLYTSYVSSSGVGSSSINLSDAHFSTRLQLDSLQEESGANFINPYVFYYNPTLLPSRNAYAQDDWGYANGINNTSPVFVPNYPANNADKRIDPTFAIAASLTSIKFPTGGAVDYEYEGNRFATTNIDFADKYAADLGVASLMGDNVSNAMTTSFSITNAMLAGRTIMNLKAKITYDENVDRNLYNIDYWITKPDNSTISLTSVTSQSFQLEPGNYQLSVMITTDLHTPIYFQIDLTGKNLPVLITEGQQQFVEINGPGLRVKKITKNFSTGSEVLRYEYSKANGLSSGQLSTLPEYTRPLTYYFEMLVGNSTIMGVCSCTVYSSTTNYPLINTRSSFVNYSRVTEYTDNTASQNGKTVYRFTNHDEYDDYNTQPIFPYVPVTSRDWKRGKELSKEIYKSTTANTFTVLNRKGYKYQESRDTTQRQSIGIKVGQTTDYRIALATRNLRYNGLVAQPYNLYSDAFNMVADTLTVYDDPTMPLKDVKTYVYSDKNYQLKEVHQFNSDGAETVKKFYYPIDYVPNRGSSTLLDNMLKRHITDIPIEQITTRQKPGGPVTLTSATLNKYDYFYNTLSGKNQFVLKYVYDNDLNDVNTSAMYDFINTPSRYREKGRYVNFNAKGAPASVVQNEVQTTAYVWGYNDLYPIAAVGNAASNNIFHENFEGGNGNSALNDSRTGTYSKTNAYSKSLTGLDAGAYILSYWKKAGGLWTMQKQTVTVSGGTYNISIAVASGERLDDVCFYPATAQMKTFTYGPMVGMTSMTDEKGETTYYEYDSFQRLKNVRDKDQNLLKSYDYHYKQ
jgi:hypothetical protein